MRKCASEESDHPLIYMERSYFYMVRIIFLVTKVVTKKTQPTDGCKLAEVDVVVLKPGGLSLPNSGMDPEAGLLEFNTEGGVPEPDTPSPGGGIDVIAGGGVVEVDGGVVDVDGGVVDVGVGVVDAGFGVVGVEDDDDDW